MKKKTKGKANIETLHYIRRFYPGMVSEYSDSPIDHTDYKRVKRQHQANYGFQFYNRERVSAEGTQPFMSEPKGFSPTYYWGEVYTRAEVKEKFHDKETLIQNMINNDIKRIVMTKGGQAFPLNAKDVVLKPQPVKVGE